MVFKKGSTVTLRPFEAQHGQALMNWFYDVRYAAFFREFPDEALDLNAFQNMGQMMQNSGNALLVITPQDKDEPIGLMTYTCLKKSAGVFRFGILLDQSMQHQTHAIEAIILLVFYLYEHRGAQKIVVEFLEKDQHIKRITEKGGFEFETKLKQEAVVDGEFLDELRYALYKDTAYRLYGSVYESFEV